MQQGGRPPGPVPFPEVGTGPTDSLDYPVGDVRDYSIDRTRPIPNMADVHQTMGGVLGALLRIESLLGTTNAQTETPRPDITIILPGQTYNGQHNRYRVETVIVTGAPGGRIDLKVGTNIRGQFYTGANGSGGAFPFPIVVDRGVDVSAVDGVGASTAWALMLIGYPE